MAPPVLEFDNGVIVGEGAGFIKNVHPSYGFVRRDDGVDLFFMPGYVDASACPFAKLRQADRVTFKLLDHPRGLRACFIRKTVEQEGAA